MSIEDLYFGKRPAIGPSLAASRYRSDRQRAIYPNKGQHGGFKMDFDTIVFGQITLRQCLHGAGGILVALVVLSIAKKLIFPKKSNLEHSIGYTCSNCGWSGHIGKYARSCPKCNQPVH
jgi:hypothetical protein